MRVNFKPGAQRQRHDRSEVQIGYGKVISQEVLPVRQFTVQRIERALQIGNGFRIICLVAILGLFDTALEKKLRQWRFHLGHAPDAPGGGACLKRRVFGPEFLAVMLRQVKIDRHRFEQRQVAVDQVIGLFRGRMETLLSDLPADIVRGVLSVSELEPVDNLLAARAMGELRGSESFERLLDGAKRCRNILAKDALLDESGHEGVERSRVLRTAARRVWEAWDHDLLAAFRHYHETGKLEIITCGATHGFLPYLREVPGAVRAQVEVAAKAVRAKLTADSDR